MNLKENTEKIINEQSQTKRAFKFATCAVKALIFCEDECLVLSKPRWTEESKMTWNDLPGGRVNHGELFPEKALRREVIEELGNHEISILRPLHMATVLQNSEIHIIATIFLCKTSSKEITLSSEHSQYCWINPSNQKLLLPSWIKESINKVMEHS